MQALYTEIFEDFLTRRGDSVEWQAIEQKLARFPTFTLGELNLDMYDLIKEKYGIYEIGAETENIFFFEFRDKVNELLVKYVPKIEVYISNFGKMLERKVSLAQDGYTANYLYPISTTNGKVATNVKFNGNKEQMLMIFKSNAEMLEQAMNIQDVYLDCLAEFAKCFMTIY